MKHQCCAYDLVWQPGDDVETLRKAATDRALVAAWDEDSGKLYSRCPAKGKIPRETTRQELRFCETHNPDKWPPLFKCTNKKCGWARACEIDPALATLDATFRSDAWSAAIQKHLCPKCLEPITVADTYVNIRGWFLFVPPKKTVPSPRRKR